jgi:hypothetical protein
MSLLFEKFISIKFAASVLYWPEFRATAVEVSGSIPGATRFSE